jgi:hypothetical protein
MIKGNCYFTMRNRAFDLTALDSQERQLVDSLIAKYKSAGDWTEFANYYMPAVGNFYLARGLTRKQVIETTAWKIAQDLNGRRMVAAGIARAPGTDYRAALESVIRTAFPTQKAFCEATGLSEDLVSHVLARRKHLAIDTLSEALKRIGYHIEIVPTEKA